MRTNILRRAALGAVLLVAGVACGAVDGRRSENRDTQVQNPVIAAEDGDVQVVQITVDGRTVNCVIVDTYNGGGITCDWAALHEEFTP